MSKAVEWIVNSVVLPLAHGPSTDVYLELFPRCAAVQALGHPADAELALHWVGLDLAVKVEHLLHLGLVTLIAVIPVEKLGHLVFLVPVPRSKHLGLLIRRHRCESLG